MQSLTNDLFESMKYIRIGVVIYITVFLSLFFSAVVIMTKKFVGRSKSPIAHRAAAIRNSFVTRYVDFCTIKANPQEYHKDDSNDWILGGVRPSFYQAEYISPFAPKTRLEENGAATFRNVANSSNWISFNAHELPILAISCPNAISQERKKHLTDSLTHAMAPTNNLVDIPCFDLHNVHPECLLRNRALDRVGLRKTEVGVSFSHALAWEMTLERWFSSNGANEFTIVLEDDARLLPGVLELLEEVSNQMLKTNSSLSVLHLWNGDWNGNTLNGISSQLVLNISVADVLKSKPHISRARNDTLHKIFSGIDMSTMTGIHNLEIYRMNDLYIAGGVAYTFCFSCSTFTRAYTANKPSG